VHELSTAFRGSATDLDIYFVEDEAISRR